MQSLSIEGFNEGLIFEHIARFVFGDCDHFDLVLAQVLVDKIHVGDFSRAGFVGEVVVQEATQHDDDKPVFKDG